MKKILLDTHVLLFDALTPDRLSQKAKLLLEEPNELYCSALSLWEIAMLLRKGRILIEQDHEAFMTDILLSRDIKILPLTLPIAIKSQIWAAQHKDPADLIIAATALFHNIPLLSCDEALAKFNGIAVIW